MRACVWACAGVLALVGLGAAGGCGDEEEPSDAGESGGSITIAQSAQPDFLDPALSYTVNGAEPMWLVYTPLITYRREEGKRGTELIPGLAEDLPDISDDGRTYRFKLREGLVYSDGRRVKASDFGHTIKRVLALASGGSSLYLGIVGAEEYVKGGKADAELRGITTDNSTGEITVRLNKPDGTFIYAMATLFAGVVPGDTPLENMTKNPPPGVGPYKITKSVPNREFVLERNDRFNLPGIPRGKLRRITTKIVRSSSRQTQDVIDGKVDYIQDAPDPDLKPEIQRKYSDRYEENQSATVVYFPLNTAIPPFDDRRARQAVALGLDKRAVTRPYGTAITPGCSFLPPTQPGFDPELNGEGCPWGDPTKPPDLKRARALLEESGQMGADVTVYGHNENPTPTVTQAYADQLERIGFDTKVRLIDADVYYATIGNRKTRFQTGWARWSQDFPHPKTFFFLLDGKSIQPTNSFNFGNVDDPEITRGIARLNSEPILTEESISGWKELNRKAVEVPYVVPYGHLRFSTFLSERLDFENCSRFHPVYLNDYSSFCLKD